MRPCQWSSSQDDEAAAYGRYAGTPSQGELDRMFFLDDADRALIARRRGDHTRLGFALQLTTVRYLGTFLPDPLEVPAVVLDRLAGQLQIADPSRVKRYTERRTTPFEHRDEIKAALLTTPAVCSPVRPGAHPGCGMDGTGGASRGGSHGGGACPSARLPPRPAEDRRQHRRGTIPGGVGGGQACHVPDPSREISCSPGGGVLSRWRLLRVPISLRPPGPGRRGAWAARSPHGSPRTRGSRCSPPTTARRP